MNQTANPLDQLRDIQLPDEIHSFALAPGWWVLLALALIAVGFLIFIWIKRNTSLRLLKPAHKELQAIAELAPNNQAVAQLSALLKRLCLIYFNKQQVASLNGSRWVEFLNEKAGRPLIDDALKPLFTDLVYRPGQTVEPALWEKLIESSGQIVEAIIRNNTGKKL